MGEIVVTVLCIALPFSRTARTFCHVIRASDMAHAVNTCCTIVHADAHAAAYLVYTVTKP